MSGEKGDHAGRVIVDALGHRELAAAVHHFVQMPARHREKERQGALTEFRSYVWQLTMLQYSFKTVSANVAYKKK